VATPLHDLAATRGALSNTAAALAAVLFCRTAMSETDDHDVAHELRSFGRRRGRTLNARQQKLIDEVLPACRLALAVAAPAAKALATTLTPGASATWLEIGFGGGEHLVAQAIAHPDVAFVGCEPFLDGVVKVLAQIEERKLGNIRLHDDDARDVLRWLPVNAIDRAFILFPDPWPKTRHRKRRLVSGPTLALLARVMRPGAELRVATDIGDYARTILEAIGYQSALRWTAAGPADWRLQGDDWPVTRYQQKAIREGRSCYFLRFVRA
jgi:tRNA (guanine-N7-)-methyltransferase